MKAREVLAKHPILRKLVDKTVATAKRERLTAKKTVSLLAAALVTKHHIAPSRAEFIATELLIA